MRKSLTTFGKELSTAERSRMGSANIAAAFDFLEILADSPELIDRIPDGATITMNETGDPWVDQQNALIKAERGEAIGSRDILSA